jgi:hypothetical protein
MSKKANLYLGRAGQLAVMSEFIDLGYNAGVPEVDIGDDIFVVRDSDGDMARIQVKTATGKPKKKKKGGYSATFLVRLSQLKAPHSPELTYVLVARLAQRWESFVIISRTVLETEHVLHSVGSPTTKTLKLYLSYSEKNTVTCSKRDWTQYLGDWSKWPRIQH